MSTAKRREKVFGVGPAVPLDRNVKARIFAYARARSHRTEKGKHYGDLTAKFLDVLGALLYGFHNAASGRCFPSYKTIADRARCSPSTVAEAVQALDRIGILTWVNRIVRVREWGPDLFGRARNRWRVIRTSNAYSFIDPGVGAGPHQPSKSEIPARTINQEKQDSSFNSFRQEIGAAQIALDLEERRKRWGSVNDVLRDRGLAAFKDRRRA